MSVCFESVSHIIGRIEERCVRLEYKFVVRECVVRECVARKCVTLKCSARV